MPNKSTKIEYICRKKVYYFAEGTQFFAHQKEVIVLERDKKPVKITKYLDSSAPPPNTKKIKVGLTITPEGAEIAAEYAHIPDFLVKNKNISLLDFDFATGHELALLVFFRRHEADGMVAKIKSALPFLINIFRSPVIHLKDVEAVLDLDAVKRVNQNTVRHLSTHSENWENVRGGVPMPRKMLTRVYEDDYGIYENIVFKTTVDLALAYLRREINNLSSVLDTLSEGVRPEEFSRLVHPLYYLAVGKLYNGFFKTESTTDTSAELKEARALYDRLASFKTKAVYAKNAAAKPIEGGIKKTNILGMHRDYQHVFSLYNSLRTRTVCADQLDLSALALEQAVGQRSYFLFCQLLTAFAALHFCFSPADKNFLAGGRVNTTLKNKNWRLRIAAKSADIDFIRLTITFKKDSLNFALIPLAYKASEEQMLQILQSLKIKDKRIVFLSPFVEFRQDFASFSVLPVSISRINSFRFIQSLIFEGMMLTSDDHVCGFCGSILINQNGKITCQKCRTVIKYEDCTCGERFKTVFADFKKADSGAEEFRSINYSDAPVCPACKKILKKQ